MTSTFSSSKSSHNLIKTNRSITPRQIEAKKETLLALEDALKKRISELKELCLKEGELTGHLPVDYPLQPREPIPQVRRRINHSVNNNINNNRTKNQDVENSIAQLLSMKAQQQNPNLRNGQGMIGIPSHNNPNTQMHFPSRQQNMNSIQPSPATFVTPSQANNTAQIYFPSRPTSTNSTSSSNSTASSNTRSLSNNNAPHYFQPYYEETKPFQMSDFYKYSSKHRTQKIDEVSPQFKTTRQLQEDVLKKNSLKYNTCDDQIQASVKLIEKSGQKLIEATAKAIASNPGLAEKINKIRPNNIGDRY